MKLFQCQNCGSPLYFENTRCESCGLALGYLPTQETVSALEPDRTPRRDQQQVWIALADGAKYRYCANIAYGVCNWLVPSAQAELYCAACRHNQMVPDLSLPVNVDRWRALENAKHRLFYTLLQLRLPVETNAESQNGLAFQFLADVAPMLVPGLLSRPVASKAVDAAQAPVATRAA